MRLSNPDTNSIPKHILANYITLRLCKPWIYGKDLFITCCRHPQLNIRQRLPSLEPDQILSSSHQSVTIFRFVLAASPRPFMSL